MLVGNNNYLQTFSFSSTKYYRFLCNIALYIIGLYFHHQSHPQVVAVFALAPSLYSFWSYFFTNLQQHIGHLPTWGVHHYCPIFLPFHTVHGILKERTLKQFAIPFSSGPHFARTLQHDPSVLGSPTQHTLKFTESDKAAIHLINLVCFL